MKHLTTIDKQYSELVATLKSYQDTPELPQVEKAWQFAKRVHGGQMRKTGDPYTTHLLSTAQELTNWKLDTASVIAGLLHDTIEDAGVTFEELAKEFGEEVATLVIGVTKVSALRLRGSRSQDFVENLRKMFLAMAKDLRVVLVKLADRHHNVSTLYALPSDKQKKIAVETLEVYAPLAERLGMGQVKSKLEELAFPYAFPRSYKRVKKGSASYYKEAAKRIKKMKTTLLRSIAEEGIRVTVQARQKNLYSLWGKLKRPNINWDFEKVHDIIALRILTNSVAECYVALGIVHSTYKPVPKLGISDFIAQPKPNGYQSIHTRVFGPNGKMAEVQIRTFEMHDQAEHGVAAHWAYSDAKTKGVSDSHLEKGKVQATKSKLNWIKELASWQREISDSKEFMEAVKFDALKERNFIFSPNGDVFDLPTGATPVDFAYAVHTDLGNFIQAAKVNGRMVPLNYQLKSGDVVEILKTKNPKKPSRDWLKFVSTNSAKSKIKKDLS